MGATYVTVTVKNPAEPERTWEGTFLVDAGSTNSIVPRKHLEAIGIQPAGTRRYELADGNVIDLDTGGANFEFLGQCTPAYVVFGDDGAEPLLGLTAMEAVGVQVDPANRRLTLLPPQRL